MKNVSNQKKGKGFLLTLLGLLLIWNMNAQVQSGLYSDCLVLSVNKSSNQVSGYVWRYIYNDDNPSLGIYQTCYLFFKGNYTNLQDTIKINIYNSFDSKSIANGNLYCIGNKMFFQINANIISCMNAFDFKNGELFELKKGISLLFCSRIKANKAFFYIDKKRLNNHLIKGDFISISKTSNDLYLVHYIDKNGKTIEGWIKKNDVE